jgi:hypothetical protein
LVAKILLCGHRKIDVVNISGFSKDDRLLKVFDDFFEILPEESVRKRLPSKHSSRFQTLATESSRCSLLGFGGDAKFRPDGPIARAIGQTTFPRRKRCRLLHMRAGEQLRHEEQCLERRRRSRLHYFSLLFQPSDGRCTFLGESLQSLLDHPFSNSGLK